MRSIGLFTLALLFSAACCNTTDRQPHYQEAAPEEVSKNNPCPPPRVVFTNGTNDDLMVTETSRGDSGAIYVETKIMPAGEKWRWCTGSCCSDNADCQGDPPSVSIRVCNDGNCFNIYSCDGQQEAEAVFGDVRVWWSRDATDLTVTLHPNGIRRDWR